MLTIKVQAASETAQLAQQLARLVADKPLVLSLKGPLGSGKTLFAAEFGKTLGVKRAIKSPTYTIVKEYPLAKGDFVHVDAYRLEGFGGEDLDLVQYIDRKSWLVIEWAEFIQDELPETYLQIEFIPSADPEARTLQLTVIGQSASYQAILKRLSEERNKC